MQFDEQIKLKQIRTASIYNCKDSMCTFGDYHFLDLQINNQTNQDSYSSCDLGYSYELPKGKDQDWFAGSSEFKVVEIEVYSVKFL